MYVSINKQLIRLQNCYGVFLGFASEVLQDVELKCLRTGHVMPYMHALRKQFLWDCFTLLTRSSEAITMMYVLGSPFSF